MRRKILIYLISIAITVLCSWFTLCLGDEAYNESLYAIISLIVAVFVFGSLWGYKSCTIGFCVSEDHSQLVHESDIKFIDDISSALMRFCVIWSIGCSFTLLLSKGSKIQGIVSLIVFVIYIFNNDKQEVSYRAYFAFKKLVEKAREERSKMYRGNY